MKEIKLSIIVPIYNVEKYLEKCIESLLKQDEENYEILLINDGSTDNSLEICKKYESEYKNIKVFNKKNGGLSSARNYGLDKAEGKYISFIDSDDWISANYIEEIYRIIDSDKNVDVITYNMIYINDGWDNGTTRKVYNDFENMDRKEIIKECYNPSFAWARVYKKDIINKYRFPTKDIWYEDMYIMPAILSNCKKIKYIDKELYFYRQRKSSITASVKNKKTLGVIKSWEQGLKTVNNNYLEEFIFALYKSIVSFIYFKPEYAQDFLNYYNKKRDIFKNNNYINDSIKNGEYEDLSLKKIIPRKIHYCWFGNGKKGELFEKCLESWKKYAPDFEIIEWNESNCDINECKYVKEAYENKKWAFVSDYFRTKVLAEFGGIYVDTDVEFKNYIYSLTVYNAFFAFETSDVNAAIFGCIPDNKVLTEMYESYKKDKFILQNGNLNTDYPIPRRITDILKKNTNIQLNGKTQLLNNNIMIYSADILTINVFNEKNIAEHHYEATWWDVTYGITSYKFEVLKYYFQNVEVKYESEMKLKILVRKIIPYKTRYKMKKILRKLINR